MGAVTGIVVFRRDGSKHEVLIDTEDLPKVEDHTWVIDVRPNALYCYARFWDKETKVQSKVYLHRHIMCSPEGMVVDHINRNGLDNRKANLRICSQSENLANARGRGGHSNYKGVTWFKPANLWMAQIRVQGEHKYLGYFKEEEEAARAYDKAALEHFGEFARLNFPVGTHL